MKKGFVRTERLGERVASDPEAPKFHLTLYCLPKTYHVTDVAQKRLWSVRTAVDSYPIPCYNQMSWQPTIDAFSGSGDCFCCSCDSYTLKEFNLVAQSVPVAVEV